MNRLPAPSRACAFLLLLACPIAAQIEVFPPVSDGAVLQREAVVRVLGRAPKPGPVSIEPSWPGGTRVTATADKDGAFSADLTTAKAGGPFTMTVRAGAETLEIKDLLLGDVWLCSGQSNMEWAMHQGVQGAEQAIARAAFPQIRHFKVPLRTAALPTDRIGGAWMPCDPEHARDFTAVGFFFARKLQPQVGVPIGLLNSSWGGTPAESWISGEVIERHGGFEPHLALLKKLAAEPQASLRDRRAAWWKKMDAEDPGVAAKYAEPGHDAASWQAVTLPDRWSGDLESFDGTVWYRREIDIPSAWADRNLVVELGPVDDCDLAYWNGVGFGETLGDGAAKRPRRYVLPAKLAKAGKATLAVRVLDFSGAGGVGSAEIKPRIFQEGDPSSAVPLAEGWRRKTGAPLSAAGAYPRNDGLGEHTASAVYNAMIAPILGFPIKGALWYQGESNVARAEQYRTLFPALIADWRARYKSPALPFYFVQIAPYDYDGDEGAAAELRIAQEHAARTVASTGMVVISDVGDPRDIHPRDKRTVGERLAAFAAVRTYGLPGPAPESPRPTGATRFDDRFRIAFEFGAGLKAQDGKPPSHCELRGKDGVWRKAVGRVEEDGLTLTAEGVAEPVEARFSYGAADQPNVVNGAGLPVGPFRISAQ